MATPPSTPPAPPPWLPAGVPRRSPGWPTIAWLVAITLVAGVAIVGWLRPLRDHTPSPVSPKPTYTDQQVAKAQADVCAVFGKIDHGLELADAESARSSDRTAQVAAAALTRQVLDFGSRYLSAKVAEEPATPSELASAVRQQSNAFQELLVGYMDGAVSSDPSLQPAQKSSDEATATIRRLCK